MNAEDFVACWRREKDELLRGFMGEQSTSAVAKLVGEMSLTPQQRTKLIAVLDGALTDTMYTLLLGLDGEASIGDVQHTYRIQGEDGTVISECGQIEAEAWRQFHGPG